MKKQVEWWENNGGFFGEKYIEGDDSLEGFILGKKENLSQRTNKEVQGIIDLTDIPKGAKILDIPCGYGRHTIELYKRGFSILGMDINDQHLKRAKENSKSQKIVFLKKDMRDIGKENYEKFDLVINMFYSFGFFKNESDNEKTMGEFYKALKKGGKLLLHTDVSPEIINWKYKFKEERTLSNGRKLIIEEKYNQITQRMEGSWTIISKNRVEKLAPYSVRIYTKNEFEKLAKKFGFKSIKFYGSFNGEDFKEGSNELIMVAGK